MSRKRLSVRRQNEIAAQPDPDLPTISLNAPSTSKQRRSNNYSEYDQPIIPDLTTPVPLINLSSTSLNHTPANQLNLESDREADMELDEDSDSEPCEDNSEDFFLSTSDESEEDDQEETLRSNLKRIAIEDNMNISTVSKILHALSLLHPSLPLDGRTLLGTPTHLNVRTMDNGKYFYLGLKTGLIAIANSLTFETIHLLFNIDGILISKGNQSQLWPILCKVRNVKSDVFAVAIFKGEKSLNPSIILWQSLSQN